MATENIMMESVKRGGNRQELHEALRVHSHAAAAEVKINGGVNDLIDRIAADPLFPLSKADILAELEPKKYIGRSVSQTENFVRDIAMPVIEKYHSSDIKSDLKV
jgi:adenylosuccinate lyase